MSETKIEIVGGNDNVYSSPTAPSSESWFAHLQKCLNPVKENEILGGAESKGPHARLNKYVNSASKRNSTDLKSTSDVVADAKHVVRQGSPNSAHAGVVKDLAIMFGMVTDVDSGKLTANEKYQIQKQANRAVWRCLNVERTGVPKLWRAAKQLFREPLPTEKFPDKDLRDILVNVLDKMSAWIVPVDRFEIQGSDSTYGLDIPKSARKDARQEKSLKRVGEVLERIDNPRLQAQVVAKMVSIGEDVPGALKHASAWLTGHRGNMDRKIVFDEAIKLIACDNHDARWAALKLVDDNMAAIKNMSLDDRKELKETLKNKVLIALNRKMLPTNVSKAEGDRLHPLVTKLQATIREISDAPDRNFA